MITFDEIKIVEFDGENLISPSDWLRSHPDTASRRQDYVEEGYEGPSLTDLHNLDKIEVLSAGEASLLADKRKLVENG